MVIEAPAAFWDSRLGRTFAALRYRNYRLWFIGQLVSLLGTWMQMTAQGFLVFELTHSTAYLGYVAFAFGIPPWLFMLYGGVVADRISRRTLLLITQSSMMLLAAVLAALTFTGWVQPWHILVLAFCLGVANAFDAPSRQAIVLELVEREDLTNAIALNSTMFNSASAVGPAAAGLVYAGFGPGWCFAANAATFVAVLLALALMRLPPRPDAGSAEYRGAWQELREGLGFVVGHPHVRILVGLVTVLAFFGIAFGTLIPAWAVDVLGGDATTNGFLQSARGIGALLGALAVASLGRFRFHGRLLSLASFVFPAALLVYSAIRIEWLSLAALVLVGVGLLVAFNVANAMVQTLAPDALRGRVMSIYSLAFFGFVPLGGLTAGALADRVGAPVTVALAAAAVLLFAAAVRVFHPGLSRLP